MSSENIISTAKALAKEYSEMAVMNLSMEYYEFYEKFYNLSIDYIENGREAVKSISLAVRNLYTKETSDEEVIDKLSILRDEIIDRTEVIEAVADYLRIHEYILNRTELKFSDNVPEIDNDEEARKMLQFIFESDDNTVVNLRIQEMIAQMPVRITSSRFFDLLREAFSVYKDSERETLKGFVYLILSAAGISESADKNYFKDLDVYKKTFSEIDYNNITEAEYNEYTNLIADAGDALGSRSEFLLSAVRVLNALLAIYILKPYVSEESRVMGYVSDCLIKICDGFDAEQEDKKNFAAIPEELADSAFSKIEGLPEKASAKISMLEGKIEAGKDELIKGDGELYQKLTDAGILMSTSDFARIDRGIDVTACTEEIINETYEGVCTRLKEVFEAGGKKYKRAVMASVLKEIPVFFISRTEVMNYLRFTMDNCGDNAEKAASVNLFWEAVK